MKKKRTIITNSFNKVFWEKHYSKSRMKSLSNFALFIKKKILKKNIWGVDIKPEFPRRPHIIKNDFSKSLAGLSKELESKIKKIYL